MFYKHFSPEKRHLTFDDKLITAQIKPKKWIFYYEADTIVTIVSQSNISPKTQTWPLFLTPYAQLLPSLVARGMHSRWAALNRCHCELETDGNEGSLQSGSPAAVLCTRCQGVMTAQRGGTQRYRRQHHLCLTPTHTHTKKHMSMRTHTHTHSGSAKVQRGGVLAPIPASRNVKVEI